MATMAITSHTIHAIAAYEGNRPWLAETRDVCDRCDLPGGEWHRMNCAYVDEAQNWVWLCAPCAEEVDEIYADMWSEYYASVL